MAVPLSPEPQGKLQTVQAGRALAALAVVLAHAATLSGFGGGLFKAGHAGVDFFFVLSGFIILAVHAGDIGRPHRLAGYVRKRLGRIYPPYWVASVIAVALAATGLANSVNGGLARFDWPSAIHAALLLPSHDGPFIGVGWTLEHEMMFYVVFGALILHRAAGLVLLGAWLGWSLLASVLYPLSPFPWSAPNLWVDSIGSSYHLQFGAGMLVAWGLSRRRLRHPLLFLGAGLAFLASTATAENLGGIDGLGQTARFFYGSGAALVLAGVVQAERDRVLAAPAWLVFLGEASYSIYLLHVPVMMALASGWHPVPGIGAFAALAFAGLFAGCGMHVLAERPLLAAVRGGRRDRPATRVRVQGAPK